MSKKRSPGEGTIRQREGGRWEGTLMVGYQSDGRRKYKTFYGRTQTEVKKKLREYQVAKENGELIGMEYNFSDWADIWYENHRDNIKPTTVATITVQHTGSMRKWIKTDSLRSLIDVLMKLYADIINLQAECCNFQNRSV